MARVELYIATYFGHPSGINTLKFTSFEVGTATRKCFELKNMRTKKTQLSVWVRLLDFTPHHLLILSHARVLGEPHLWG